MFRRSLALVATLAATVGLGVAGTAAAAPPATRAVTTITYDDSAAAEFTTAVAQGVSLLNSRLTTVRIVKAPAGTTANVRVVADDGWPRATLGPVRPGGRGTVWFGREAVADGYYPPRIASHEFGHTLGLPDNRTGRCSDLMSGSSAPVSCTNAYPSSTEASRVDSTYASAVTAARPEVVLLDAA